MPPQRTGGLTALSGAGAIAYVANLIDQGYDLFQVRTFVGRRFSNFPQRSLDALIEAGYASREAGRLISAGEADTTLAASAVPGYAAGRTGYRYVSASVFVSPTTGDTERFYAVIDSPTQLTPGQLRQRVGGLFGSRAAINQRQRRLSGPQAGMQLQELDIISVERITP